MEPINLAVGQNFNIAHPDREIAQVMELGNSDSVLQRAERKLYLDVATLLEAPRSPSFG